MLNNVVVSILTMVRAGMTMIMKEGMIRMTGITEMTGTKIMLTKTAELIRVMKMKGMRTLTMTTTGKMRTMMITTRTGDPAMADTTGMMRMTEDMKTVEEVKVIITGRQPIQITAIQGQIVAGIMKNILAAEDPLMVAGLVQETGEIADNEETARVIS